MAKGQTKKQTLAKARKDAASAPLAPMKRMDPTQQAFIIEYANTLDEKAALDVAGVPEKDHKKFLALDKIKGMMNKIENLSLMAVDWNKAKATANAVRLTNVLMEKVEAGDMKAANAAQRMVELGMTSHGLGKKQNEGNAPKISVNINLQQGGQPGDDAKVVDVETEE